HQPCCSGMTTNLGGADDPAFEPGDRTLPPLGPATRGGAGAARANSAARAPTASTAGSGAAYVAAAFAPKAHGGSRARRECLTTPGSPMDNARTTVAARVSRPRFDSTEN